MLALVVHFADEQRRRRRRCQAIVAVCAEECADVVADLPRRKLCGIEQQFAVRIGHDERAHVWRMRDDPAQALLQLRGRGELILSFLPLDVLRRRVKNGVDVLRRSQCLLGQHTRQTEQILLRQVDGLVMNARQAEHGTGEDRRHRQAAQREYQITQPPHALLLRSAYLPIRSGRSLAQTEPPWLRCQYKRHFRATCRIIEKSPEPGGAARSIDLGPVDIHRMRRVVSKCGCLQGA